MPADKPRAQQNTHDLMLSLVPLVLLILAMAGLARACTLSPGGPSEAAPPTIDVTQALTQDATEVDFAVRLPELPDGWVANSGEVRDSGDGQSVRTGFITAGGSYLRLVQSDLSEARLVPDEVGSERTASGTVDVDGTTWVVHDAEGDGEVVWVTDTGAVRLLITGSGSAEEFRVLAQAVLDGRTLLG